MVFQSMFEPRTTTKMQIIIITDRKNYQRTNRAFLQPARYEMSNRNSNILYFFEIAEKTMWCFSLVRFAPKN